MLTTKPSWQCLCVCVIMTLWIVSWGLPLTQDIKIPWLLPNSSRFFPDHSNSQKLRHLRISVIMYLNHHGVHACICFKYKFFVKNNKFSMKCVENYDTSGKVFWYAYWSLQLLWNINYVKFPWLFLFDLQQNSKFPWLILKFPDFSWPVAGVSMSSRWYIWTDTWK